MRWRWEDHLYLCVQFINALIQEQRLGPWKRALWKRPYGCVSDVVSLWHDGNNIEWLPGWWTTFFVCCVAVFGFPLSGNADVYSRMFSEFPFLFVILFPVAATATLPLPWVMPCSFMCWVMMMLPLLRETGWKGAVAWNDEVTPFQCRVQWLGTGRLSGLWRLPPTSASAKVTLAAHVLQVCSAAHRRPEDHKLLFPVCCPTPWWSSGTNVSDKPRGRVSPYVKTRSTRSNVRTELRGCCARTRKPGRGPERMHSGSFIRLKMQRGRWAKVGSSLF